MSEPVSPAEVAGWVFRVALSIPGRHDPAPFGPPELINIVHGYRRSAEVWDRFVEKAWRTRNDMILFYGFLRGDHEHLDLNFALIRGIRMMEVDGWEMDLHRRQYLDRLLRRTLDEIVAKDTRRLLKELPTADTVEAIAHSWEVQETIREMGFSAEGVALVTEFAGVMTECGEDETDYDRSAAQYKRSVLIDVWTVLLDEWKDKLPDRERLREAGVPACALEVTGIQ